MSEPLTVDADLQRLEQIIRRGGPSITAFSGGVDSTLVAVAAARVHGKQTLAVTGVSPSLSAAEHEHARRMADQLGLRHRLIDTHELTRPRYRANAGDRCYHCKTELFERLVTLARDEGYPSVLSGDNLDDLGGHRPGLAAAAQLGIRQPLVEAALGKAQIRALARRLGLPNHAKPASPCLASRIPSGTPVDAQILARIEQAEDGVRALGFRIFRVRHHGDLARIELDAAELPAALGHRLALVAACKRAGYRFVALDLAGFRSGSLSIVDEVTR
ncbi:MAG: ATP-dependent sacrificial sulfur transferase LarE [Myxococcota bacterium]